MIGLDLSSRQDRNLSIVPLGTQQRADEYVGIDDDP